MAAIGETSERKGFRLQSPPEWGIEPVPQAERRLGFVDFAVLWGDLGIGLLVLLAGSFLVPGLGVPQAMAAIVIGSAIGCALLTAAGLIGSKLGAPTMVLLRPALGIRGSYLPTVLNIVQLIGWTIFEIIIMASAANAVSLSLFGLNSYPLWALVSASVVILMGVGGPLVIIRQWLSKVAVWVMLATTLWLTWRIFSTNDVANLLQKPGDGSLPFWVGVDLVISMPVSWLPLVADYNRFAREPRGAAWGTFVGFFVTNVWFFALGVLILLTSQVEQGPREFASAIALTAGALALVILLVDETDNAWADLYSAAVSTQNIFPHLRQSALIIVMGVLASRRAAPGRDAVRVFPAAAGIILRATVRRAASRLFCRAQREVQQRRTVHDARGYSLGSSGRVASGRHCVSGDEPRHPRRIFAGLGEGGAAVARGRRRFDSELCGGVCATNGIGWEY